MVRAWKDGGRSCDRRFQAWKDGNRFCNRRLLLPCGKGGGFFSPRRLAVSRMRDAMDASGHTRHFATHTAPLFQQDAPPLVSSQWPPLVASQRNAPLQQLLVHSQREGVAPLQQLLDPLQQPLVTSQQDGVAPLQQPLVPSQWLRLVSHEDVPSLVSSRRDVPSMNQARGLPLHLWGRRFIAKLCSTLVQDRACVMVSSDDELPNKVFYHDLDGSTCKVKVSYYWKPQQCKVCLSFEHANSACQQPSQKITQVYQPRQEPQHGVATTIPSTDTPVPTVTVAEKMNEHSNSLGQRDE
ncbi:hypothetical protein B296_00053807 [Ensete ventricosum]|uniref:Uncharacterized protein n=1 Tax=Ensete ventricosum TaxID=4639 RepID=A0A426Y2K8_ENSVE|nr:hypothetical protein B296_00053807 [Ensete ventricosum]